MVKALWERETGKPLAEIPEGLGKFELGSDDYSIGLALQQITPYVRTGQPLPASFAPPIVRGAYGHGKGTPAAQSDPQSPPRQTYAAAGRCYGPAASIFLPSLPAMGKEGLDDAADQRRRLEARSLLAVLYIRSALPFSKSRRTHRGQAARSVQRAHRSQFGQAGRG